MKYVAFLLIAGGIFGLSKIKPNNYFLEDLSPQSSLRQDLDYFESGFSGIRPFELIAKSKENRKIYDLKVLRDVENLENYLEDDYGIQPSLSLVGLFKGVNQMHHGGNSSYYRLPADQNEHEEILDYIIRKDLWNTFIPLVDSSYSSTRISVRSKDLGSSVYTEKNTRLMEYSNSNLNHIEIHLTGTAHLMDRTNTAISNYLVFGISLAILVSSLCVLLLTGSYKLALISIIPNIIPLLMAGLIMWWFVIPLKVGTAIVFTIIYGLAVDDTMHILYQYKLQSKERTDGDSIFRTYQTLKKPMFRTTLVLSMGFMVLSFSQFSSIAIIGILIAISLWIALIADFVILPAFLKREGLFP